MSLQGDSWVRRAILIHRRTPVPLPILAQLKLQRASPLLKTRFSLLELVKFYDAGKLSNISQELVEPTDS